jgi:hypothetical protein
MLGRMKCPKCVRELSPEGEICLGDERMTVYQCDHCVRPWQFDGATFDAALTFAVDSAGQMFDPATGESLNLN